MLAETIEKWLRRYLADPKSHEFLIVKVQDEEALFVQWVTVIDPPEFRGLHITDAEFEQKKSELLGRM